MYEGGHVRYLGRATIEAVSINLGISFFYQSKSIDRSGLRIKINQYPKKLLIRTLDNKPPLHAAIATAGTAHGGR